MRFTRFVAGVGGVAAISACLTLLPSSAFADYGPTQNDVVGVGSDTIQAAGDFIADGDYVGDAGYNTAGNLNKFINLDATADANTRLAYGVNGKGSGTCTPGTGTTEGTGNQTTTHANTVCVLNPTVVLRAGLSPVQRPNGSGAGYNLLKADTDATGNGKGLIDFSRASSARGTNALFDSMQIGNDPLGMLTAAVATTHVKRGLTVSELTSIYNCTATNWSSFGGTAGTIIPLIPQLGSGTRSYFEGQLGLTDSTIGSCVQTVEENDPTAIGATSSPADAIEPMSQSRLYLFQGKLSDGTASGAAGYFNDPSCIGDSANATCTSTPLINPAVKLWTTADTAGTFYPTRPLYIYFRHADINSTKAFQPGGSLNWVRTMLYNPGGSTPYWCSGAGQADISAAGIIPACVYTPGGP